MACKNNVYPSIGIPKALYLLTQHIGELAQ